MLEPRIAAIRYAPGQSVRPVLDAFVATLRARDVDVHGLFQEVLWDENGERKGTDAIDIRTGERIALKRPSPFERNNRVCSLSLAKLAEATMVLRRALDQGAEIVVVERFGKTEGEGGGLADDLLALMASGIPTVITVPEAQMDGWLRFSGGLGQVMECELDVLLQWWEGSA